MTRKKQVQGDRQMARKTSNEQPYTWEEIAQMTPGEMRGLRSTYGDVGIIVCVAALHLLKPDVDDCPFSNGPCLSRWSFCVLNKRSPARTDRDMDCYEDAMNVYIKYLKDHEAELREKGWIVGNLHRKVQEW